MAVTASSRPGRWRLRYLAYGPISDAPSADQSKIAKLIQRGRAVTDDRLAAQALAYARFRIRVCSAFGLIFLVVAAGEVGEVVSAAFGSANLRIVYAVLIGFFLLSSFGWLWQADRCRRGARATAQACAARRQEQ